MTRATWLGLATAVVTGFSVTTAAQAAPIGPAPALRGEAPIAQVRDGCGPGGYRDYYGICRGYRPPPRYGYYGYPPPRPRPYYGGYGFYGPRPYY